MQPGDDDPIEASRSSESLGFYYLGCLLFLILSDPLEQSIVVESGL
jgi:hypothetical protein